MDVYSIETGRPLTPTATNTTGSQDFETFLKMLTTQIQNQDPLSPMQADQFATQLASFSMVEQQTLTNQNLQMLSSVLEAGRMAGYANMVGRFVLHQGPFTFSGALLHKLSDGQAAPFPGHTYPTASVTGMPSAVKPFMTATRI